MKPSEVLDKALDVLADESDWCQRKLYDAVGAETGEIKMQHCMVGALHVAMAGGHNHVRWDHAPYSSLNRDVREALSNVVTEQYGWCGDGLGFFNDTHTYSEVRSTMEKAKAHLEEQGQ